MFATLLLFLLNAGLVAVPIGGAVGVLGGIDSYRRAHGQAPLFSNPGGGDSDGIPYGDGGGGGGGGGGDGGGSGGGNGSGSGNWTWDGDKPNATHVIGGVTVSEYCQQYNSIVVNTTSGQNYTVNPNQWGWTASDGGSLCVNVTTNNNATYASNTTAPRWSATWQYDKGSIDAPVHAYPNIMIDGGVLPAKLGKLSLMRLDVKWAYLDGDVVVAGTEPTTSTAKVAASSAAAAASESAAASVAASALASAASAAADTDTAAGTGTAAAAATTATTPAAAATTATTPAAAATTATPAAAATTATPAAAATTATPAKRSVDDVTFSANVAVDMFFDKDADRAQLTSNATYEVMVWLCQFGKYTDPIGISDGIVASQMLNGFNFSLYAGTNSHDQYVLTWISQDVASTFNDSLLPLITTLPSLGLDAAPSATDYLGYFAFGSEAYYSTDTVTFDVQSLSMDIW